MTVGDWAGLTMGVAIIAMTGLQLRLARDRWEGRSGRRKPDHIASFTFRAGIDPDGRVICGGCGSPVDVAATSSTERIGVAVLSHMLADPTAHTAMLAALDQAAAHARDRQDRDGR